MKKNYYLEDLLKDPHLFDDFLEKPLYTCKKCKCKLNFMAEEVRRMDKKLVCADCYYDALGEEIEKHPIASAGIRRGGKGNL